MLRNILALCLVAAAAVFGFVAWAALQPRPERPLAVPAQPAAIPVAAPRPLVLVAARPLAPGALLKDEDLASREPAPGAAAEELLPSSEETKAELRGALVRRYLEAGTPVGRADVLRPRDRGFLAAVLRAGTRAISIGVDAVTGTAGLIWPGDQVDLILTQELSADAAPLARRVIGETVLTDVRVIAVDQVFTQGAATETPISGGHGHRSVAQTVTLEVMPEQAERVAVAARLGRLSLTVRAMVGPGEPARTLAGVSIFGADVSPALSQSDTGLGVRMRVFQGGDTPQEVTFR